MSARIPETMLLSDLLKPTGYDCPEDLQGKTFEEATSGSSDLKVQTNKEATITENGTIVIGPDEGYDATKKVTATVNVPSGGSATAYAWVDTDDNVQYTDFGTSPSSLEEISNKKVLVSSVSESSLSFLRVTALSGKVQDYTRISDTSFTYSLQLIPDFPAVTQTLTRDPTKDFTLWG
jgi:hypothetical protein